MHNPPSCYLSIEQGVDKGQEGQLLGIQAVRIFLELEGYGISI